MTKHRVTVRRRISHQTGGDLNSDLFQAIEDGNLESVKYLVQKGADVNHPGKYAYPLYTAITYNHLAIVKYLVEHGANVNYPGKYGSPLRNAIIMGYVAIVEYLVEHGADVNHPGKDGYSPLYNAIMTGNVDIIQSLVENGANVNHPSKDGYPPLYDAITIGNVEIVRYLVEKGADINRKNNDGWTPLHVAIHRGNLKIVEYLVENGADINRKNNDGSTPLHVAIHRGNLKIVEYLVEHGADINRQDNYGRTPLEHASYIQDKYHSDKPDIIKDIIKYLSDKLYKKEKATTGKKLDELFYELNGLQEFINENNTKPDTEKIHESKIREEFEKTLKNKCGLDSVCPVTHYKNSALIEIKRSVYLENACFSFYAFSYDHQLLKNPLTRTEWEDKIKTAIDRIRQYSKYLQIEMYHLDEDEMTSETGGGTSRRRTTRRYRGKTSRRTRSARRRIR